MVAIISVVGKSNTGKTTFMEKLISELTSRGWRVGTIKHDAHDFEIDKPGKDSWRHGQAGSKAVAISSKTKFALIKQCNGETTLDQLAMMFDGDVDIILTEGYKRADRPKIEISRKAAATELLCSPEELVALVTDFQHPVQVPHFGLDDAAGVADLLEERYIRPKPAREVALLIDGRRIVLKPFATEMLDRTLRALVSLLEGGEQAREVTLVLRDRADSQAESP